MIIYNFVGAIAPLIDPINVDYNPTSRAISALKTNGGIPRTSYTFYSPNNPNGTLIFETIEGNDVVKVFFQRTYPFGYVEVTTTPSPPVPVIVIDSIITTGQTAAGENDGTATINASGGTPPYEYSLDNVNYQSSNVFGGLAFGSYSAFVRSSANPATAAAFTIAAAPDEPIVVEPAIKDIIALSGAEISIQNAYKRVEVMSEFGKVPSILYNGDFEQWDGQNFAFWTRYGGLNFSRVQKTVTNSAGALVPVQNYILQFNEKANSGKWLESNIIPFEINETGKIQYRVSKMLDVGESSSVNVTGVGPFKVIININTKTFYAAKIRIKIGNYYLYNTDYSNTYQWVTNLATVNNPIYNKDGDINTYSYSFSIPECPVSGNMVIQLFGFEKVRMTSSTVQIFGGQETAQPTVYTVLNEYSPVSIDDITLSKSSQKEDNDVVGLLSISENLGYYTEKPDQIKILFGDYFNSANGASALSNLYAMKVGNKLSTGWYEYGTTNSPIAFGLALAKSILRAYQKPFRFWLGGLTLQPLANEFNYMNTFNFDVPGQQKFNNKIFALLGGDIDLKTNTIENAKLAEIFDRPGKSNDITVPSYPGTTPPVFVQDPNGDTDIVGIFTDEFTPEFT